MDPVQDKNVNDYISLLKEQVNTQNELIDILYEEIESLKNRCNQYKEIDEAQSNIMQIQNEQISILKALNSLKSIKL